MGQSPRSFARLGILTMPYKDPDIRRAKQREYAKAHREQANARNRKWRAKHTEYVNERARITAAGPKRKAQKAKAQSKHYMLKRQVVDAAKNVPCADCGQQYPPC